MRTSGKTVTQSRAPPPVQVRRIVSIAEFGWHVGPHAAPRGPQVPAERAGAQAVVSVLEDPRVLVEEPDHEVRVGAQPAQVIPAAHRCFAGADIVQRFADDAGVLLLVSRQGLVE